MKRLIALALALASTAATAREHFCAADDVGCQAKLERSVCEALRQTAEKKKSAPTQNMMRMMATQSCDSADALEKSIVAGRKTGGQR